MRKFALLLFCLSLFTGTLTAQNFFLKGKIIGKNDNKPVQNASVSLEGTNAGTASDDNGLFELKIAPGYLSSRIRISCIGYAAKSFSIDSLLKVKNPVLSLGSDAVLLEEVVVKSSVAKATEIIEAALLALPSNYYDKPFNVQLYSTITNFDSAKKAPYKLESVLLGYYDGYRPKGVKKFKLLEKRETGTDPLNSIKYKYWPSNELYSVDLLTDQFSRGVFNKENWKSMTIKREQISLFDRDTVFVISYEASKPTTQLTGFGIAPKYYRGKIYITSGSYAVVRHTLETNSFSYDIIYKKSGKHYFPYLVKGSRENNFKLNGKKVVFLNFNVIKIVDILFQNVEKIEARENEWDPSQIPFNAAYWKANFPN